MNAIGADVVMFITATLLLVALCRMLLGIYSWEWYTRKADELEHIHSCTEFHELQNRPKPWAIRLTDWLERRHI